MSRTGHRAGDRQRGAVLVIALILLATLVAAALAAVQASTLELAMSAAEDHRLRALAAAERALAEAMTALAAAPPGDLPAGRAGAPAGAPGDTFDFALRDDGEDLRLPVRSGGATAGHLYTVLAIGRSLRGAQVQLSAGVTVLRDASGVVTGAHRDTWARRDVE